MKRSTKYFLSGSLLLASSVALYSGIEISKKFEKPMPTQEIKAYNYLTRRAEQTKEPASNEFKKNYIQNMNKLHEKNPYIAQHTQQFNQSQTQYKQKKNQSLGLQFGGLLGIIGSYVLLCSAGRPSAEEFSKENGK